MTQKPNCKKTLVVVGPSRSSRPTATVTNDNFPFRMRTNDPLVSREKRSTSTNDNRCFFAISFGLVVVIEENRQSVLFYHYRYRHLCADQLQLSLQFSSGQFKSFQDMEICRQEITYQSVFQHLYLVVGMEFLKRMVHVTSKGVYRGDGPNTTLKDFRGIEGSHPALEIPFSSKTFTRSLQLDTKSADRNFTECYR